MGCIKQQQNVARNVERIDVGWRSKITDDLMKKWPAKESDRTSSLQRMPVMESLCQV